METSTEHSALQTEWRNVRLPHDIHAYTGGDGSPVILLPGWPQTAEAYLEIFTSLIKNHQVWAVDPPGLGDSAASMVGYDTGSISRILQESISATVLTPFHLVGHDVGAWIAYAWASQFPESVKSLTVLDSAIPGKAPLLQFPLPDEANLKLWQFSFNRLPDLPEVLTKGREKELLDWLFDHKAVHPDRITPAKRARYVECYSRPDAMSRGFAYYRATTSSARQNAAFSETKLPMPVLALGGTTGTGMGLKMTMDTLAHNVIGGRIDDCGHFVMEEQPEVISQVLLDFFKSNDSGADSS
jgi:pimeloyl-ACP methyl ester carboxylesterase